MTFDFRHRDWFALQVRTGHEFTVGVVLRTKGYDDFVPSYRSRRRWSDRWKELELPLFRGYVFCRFNGEERWPILTTPGVIRAVTLGSKELARISDEEIESIRNITKHEISVMPWLKPAIGSAVRVKDGPLMGVSGILACCKNSRYFVITIDAIQRSVAVSADQCELVAAPPLKIPLHN